MFRDNKLEEINSIIKTIIKYSSYTVFKEPIAAVYLYYKINTKTKIK